MGTRKKGYLRMNKSICLVVKIVNIKLSFYVKNFKIAILKHP